MYRPFNGAVPTRRRTRTWERVGTARFWTIEFVEGPRHARLCPPYDDFVLLQLQSLFADDFRPALRLGFDIVGKLFRRTGHRLEHLRRHEALHEGGVSEDLLDLGIDLHHDIARRAAGCGKAEPRS